MEQRNILAVAGWSETVKLGIYGNVGVEFNHLRAVSFGLEAGIDTLKVKVFGYNNRGVLNTTTSKEVEPFGFTMSAFVSF